MIDTEIIELRREFMVSWTMRAEVRAADGATVVNWAEFGVMFNDRVKALDLHAALLVVQEALGSWAMRVKAISMRWPQLDVGLWEYLETT